MPGAPVPLRSSRVYPETSLPSHVTRVERSPAIGRAVELAFLRWEKRRLEPTAAFWRDFGMHVVSADADRVVARAAGGAAAIAIAQRGPRDRFVGPAFLMSDDTDLDVFMREPGARALAADAIPGGGRGVELTDPSGRSVWLVQGCRRLDPLPTRAALNATMNTATAQPRINALVRPPLQAATIVRLGHVVLQTVDFPRMFAWYRRMLGIIPTDVQFLADGSPALAFCRLDLGPQPADHHSLVLVGGIEDKYEHSAYEVIDLDDIGQGQQILHARGHRHMWGIGRHVLGSQLFDYWYDPDGFELEHYTDGDLFTAEHPTDYSELDLGGLWAWGDDVPASMKPKKSLRNLLRVLGLLRRKAITPERLKLLDAALRAPARPWL